MKQVLLASQGNQSTSHRGAPRYPHSVYLSTSMLHPHPPTASPSTQLRSRLFLAGPPREQAGLMEDQQRTWHGLTKPRSRGLNQTSAFPPAPPALLLPLSADTSTSDLHLQPANTPSSSIFRAFNHRQDLAYTSEHMKPFAKTHED